MRRSCIGEIESVGRPLENRHTNRLPRVT
jgi:hypothetical protein